MPQPIHLKHKPLTQSLWVPAILASLLAGCAVPNPQGPQIHDGQPTAPHHNLPALSAATPSEPGSHPEGSPWQPPGPMGAGRPIPGGQCSAQQGAARPPAGDGASHPAAGRSGQSRRQCSICCCAAAISLIPSPWAARCSNCCPNPSPRCTGSWGRWPCGVPWRHWQGSRSNCRSIRCTVRSVTDCLRAFHIRSAHEPQPKNRSRHHGDG